MTGNKKNPLSKNKQLTLNPSVVEIKTPSLAAFYKLWLENNKPTSLPNYKVFSSDLVANHIDDMAFLEFEPGTHRFKIVRMGENVIKALGSEILGEYWDSLPSSAEGHARMSWAVENKLPYYVSWPVFEWGNKENSTYSAITCPLFDDYEEVELLVMCFAWER